MCKIKKMKKLTRDYYFCNQLIAENKKRMYNFLIGCNRLDTHSLAEKLYVYVKKQCELVANRNRVQLILKYKLSAKKIALLKDFIINKMPLEKLAIKYNYALNNVYCALFRISKEFMAWYNFLKGEVNGGKRKIQA